MRRPDDDFLSSDDLTHDRGAFRPAGTPGRFLKGNTMSKTGTVKFFNADKGYGFIQPDDGSDDSFVHITAVQAAGMQTLDKDQRLNFEVETGRNGKASAVNLSAAD
jgi:CspA family cold shock protein